MIDEVVRMITLQNERIEVVDVIRGFSIFGIFLVNMLDFSSPIMYVRPEEWWSAPMDRWTVTIIDIVAQASFYPLFAFLFGFSMIVFRKRVLEKALSFSCLFLRRLLALLVIGCIHAFFIWHGDILIAYALTGFILLFFHRAHSRTWLVGAIMVFVVPHFVISLLLGFAVFSGKSATLTSNEPLAIEALKHYRDGTIADIFLQRWNDWVYVNSMEGLLFTVMTLLAMCLFGGYIAQKQWFVYVEEHIRKMKTIWLFSLCIGVPLKLLPYLTEKNAWTEYVQDMFGGPALSFFYATTIFLLFRKERWRKVLLPLAAVGRMSLTNYLFQSVFCTSLFYSYGLGLYGRVHPFYGLVLAIAIYFVQVIASKRWLRSFRMGPIEWAWRTATYGKRPLLRRLR
jgi:uncharacterized protein